MHAAAEGQRVDRFVCLGDIVGYGADPNAGCDLVRAGAEFTVLGNHDAAVAGRMDYSYYYDAARAGAGLDRAACISAENLGGCASLPYTYRRARWASATARRIDPKAFEYIFALEQARELRRTWRELPHVTFIGH